MSAVIGSLRAELSASIAKFKDDMGQAAVAVEKFARRARTVSRDIGRAGAELSIGLTAPIVAMAIESGKAAAQVEDAAGQVTAALTSMGNRSGRSLEQLKKQAEDLSGSSLFDSSAVLRDLTANMLSFGNISGDMFDRAQQAAVDLATRLKEGLQPAAIQVGKALNDPIAGVTALRRVGVQFTADQEKQIKALVRSGRGLEAQKLILDELQKAFGGAGKAALDASPTGRLLKAWKQLKELIGAIVLQYLPPLVNFLTMLAQKFEALPDSMKRAIVVGAGLLALVGPILTVISTFLKLAVVFADLFGAEGLIATAGVALGEMGAAVGALVAPFLPLIAVIAAVGALVWQFRGIIGGAISFVVDQIKGAFASQLPPLFKAFGQLWADLTTGPIGTFLKTVGYILAELINIIVRIFGWIAGHGLAGIIAFVTGVIRVLDDMVKLIRALFSGDFKGAWKMAGQIVADALDGLLNVLDAVLPGIKAWLKSLYEQFAAWVGKGIDGLLTWIEGRFPGLVGAIKAMASDAIAWAKHFYEGVKTWINDNLGPLIQWAMDRIHDLAVFFRQVSARAEAASAPSPKAAPAAPEVKPPPKPPKPPDFNLGTDTTADKIKEATDKYAEAIRDLNDRVAKGLDEQALPKATAAAEELRRKIADITDDAKRSGVAIGNFAGQINALKARIDQLETAGLQKDAEAFAREVGKEDRAVRAYAQGGLAPLEDRLQQVDDAYDGLRDQIEAQIEANAVLAEKNSTAATAMADLQQQLKDLAAAHDKARDAATAQYEAEQNLENLRAQADMAQTKQQIEDLVNKSGQGLTATQERQQSIARDLDQQHRDALIKMADLQAQYDDAKRTGDTDAMNRLQQQIDLQNQLLALIEHTTVEQIDKAQQQQQTWRDFTDGMKDSLTNMLTNWKFDLSTLASVFRKLAADLASPYIDKGVDFAASVIRKTFGGGFAMGGTLKPGQWGIAGEHGPEPIFAGSKDLSIVSNPDARDMFGGGQPAVHMTVVTPDSDSFRRSDRMIARSLSRALDEVRS